MTDRYTFEKDLEPIVSGKVPLPNFEPKDLAQTINNIAAIGHRLRPEWGYARNSDNRRDWAQYFLTPAGMGSDLDGRGYVLIHGPTEPIVGTFAICQHEKQCAPDANPLRGWHPGRCVKCGMDMTIDSSD